MKILRVINSLDMGGAERSIATNVPIHIRNGWDMEVLVIKKDKTFFYQELEKNKVKVFNLNTNNVYNPLNTFKIVPYLKKYDLVHVHLFPALYWVVLAKMISFSKTKLVFTEHSTDNRRRNNPILKIIDRILYKPYDKIIAITEATKSNLLAHLKCSESKIEVIENGVAIQALKDAATELRTDLKEKLNQKIVLLQIAGLRKEKDQDTSIRALALLPEEFVLVLVGDGERREELERLTQELDLENRVFFEGKQNDVASYIRSSDLVLMSSHWEGFGRTAVEGMALGKPVIASNVPGLAEVVGGAGILFEPGNEKELSEQIVELINNKEAYTSIAQKCQERAWKYDVGVMIEKYEAIYAKILNNLTK